MVMEPLILPLMMYGTYRMNVTHTDGSGKRIKTKKAYTHIEGIDKGFYPSVNHIYINTAHGGKKLKPAAEQLLEKWQWLAKAWAIKHEWTFGKKEKVAVEIILYYPDHVKRDSHNVIKLLMDALEGICYENDYYALPQIVNFYICKANELPRMEIHFRKGVDDVASD